MNLNELPLEQALLTDRNIAIKLVAHHQANGNDCHKQCNNKRQDKRQFHCGLATLEWLSQRCRYGR